MLKPILLASAMIVAAPALAQAAPGRTPMAAEPAAPAANTSTAMPQATTPAQTTTSAPTGDAIAAQTSPATPAQATPADPVVAQQATPAQPAAGQPAAGQPVNQPTQVAQIVDREFGAYDKDSDGKLSETEFGAWMVALKKQSDPATTADSPETKKWVGAAFAQADTTKTGALTKEQLVSFLSQGQS